MEAMELQEEVLDTQDELIHTHQALSIALRGLKRTKDGEEEMNRARECAKKLDSWEPPFDKMEIQELEENWVEFLPAKPRNSEFEKTPFCLEDD